MNKNQSKLTIQELSPYLDYWIDPSFQGENRLFAFLFENYIDRTVHTKYHFLTVEIKDDNVMIDWQNFFDQPVKNDYRANDNMQKIAIGRGDEYATGFLLEYSYSKNYYKIIAVNLSKQRALDVDLKAIQQINFTGILTRDPNANTILFFIIEEAKQTILDCSQGTVKVLWVYLL